MRKSSKADGFLGDHYTFLHDWFEDKFKDVETEKMVPYDDIVKVECSPLAMPHWAFQYRDRMKMVAPEEMRNDAIGKIKNPNAKYGLGKFMNRQKERE